ncbi:arsenosugar biosynthesis arsenite methyltransferase ArsM [Pontibacter silvestris]|uniref:Arsenosugar biosynthesis arsenite methyltransferase ArsM n=1 Tax=Pontibacter silvestris TaxID=2305183 RepID=A0ABW4WSU1_9BACT|nr:arsenosugar biosynthesis arsenite methyltransferase ArsM [Pontibacter silvestris]MCC9137704.1 arsenosugar biosynthesis arsenite methyltransferase ArsM [Pontibacter silvestris]
MSNYLEAAKQVYDEAAVNPQKGLCCTTTPAWQLPELKLPSKMLEMNYGCGSTVNLRDLGHDPTVLYVGVGGGMELLQFAYFCRRKGAVIGVDPVERMLKACADNLLEAESENAWLHRNFVELREGDALSLPVEDNIIDVAAQNCLFNIFKPDELNRALAEMYRVLKPHGRLVLSDPVSESVMPESLLQDDQLRALCLSGAMPLQQYIDFITGIGFGTVEVRAKRPYRVLAPGQYDTNKMIYIESVEICAIKDPMPEDGPCVFTGKHAIYFGEEALFDDGKGHTLLHNQPLAVCDKTAKALQALNRSDIYVTKSTYHYDGGGCC